MITPTTTEIATTATDCFNVDCLSGHEIFLNSAFTPLKKLGHFCFSAESPISTSHARTADYLVSLCNVCVLQNLQYFLVSILSG